MQLNKELRDKIRRRSRRAFEGHKVHRVTMESEKLLLYRLPGSLVGKGLWQGPKIKVRKDKLGRIYVPTSV